MVSVRAGHSAVTRDQRELEGLGESDVAGVVDRQLMTQRPDARTERLVRVPADGQEAELPERHSGSIARQLPGRTQPTDDAEDFEIDQVRRMELVGNLDPNAKAIVHRLFEEKIDHGRGVDHEHGSAARPVSVLVTNGAKRGDRFAGRHPPRPIYRLSYRLGQRGAPGDPLSLTEHELRQ